MAKFTPSNQAASDMLSTLPDIEDKDLIKQLTDAGVDFSTIAKWFCQPNTGKQSVRASRQDALETVFNNAAKYAVLLIESGQGVYTMLFDGNG